MLWFLPRILFFLEFMSSCIAHYLLRFIGTSSGSSTGGWIGDSTGLSSGSTGGLIAELAGPGTGRSAGSGTGGSAGPSTYPLLHIFGHSRPVVLLLDLRMGSVSPFMIPCWSHMAALKNLFSKLLVPDHKTQMLFLFIAVLARMKKLPILLSEMLGSLSNDNLLLFGRSFWVIPAHQVLERPVISPLLCIALPLSRCDNFAPSPIRSLAE